MDANATPLSDLSTHIVVRKQVLSETVASAVLSLFRISVLATLGMTLVLASVDATFIGLGWIKPAERLITEKVILGIIGASIVQVGAAASAIVFSLFRKVRPSTEEVDDG